MAGNGDSVPSSALANLSPNASTLDDVVNSEESTTLGRFTPEYPSGKPIRTLAGIQAEAQEILNNLGLEYPPIAYVAGLTVERNTQTYRYNDVVYVNTRSDLPFTTTGAFDEGGWQVVQQINQSTVIFSADGIKGLEDAPKIDRAAYSVAGFYAGTEVGGGQFIYDASRDKADHNGGTVITPEAIAAWGGTQGNLSVLLDWTGTGTGAFVRVDSGDLKPIHFGAKPNDNSASAAATNSTALNAYGAYIQSLPFLRKIDLSDYSYYYDATFNLTKSRNCYLQGNAEALNGAGDPVWGLIYTGTSGAAIECNEITLHSVSLRGVDTANPDLTIGVKAHENVTHINSYLRWFGKAYEFNGGFYHKIRGGMIHKVKYLYYFVGSLFNFSVDCTHFDFRIGVFANGGDGPLSLKGSFERYTDSIVSYGAGEPAFLIVTDGIYVENTGSAVEPFIEEIAGETYSDQRVFLLSKHNLVGSADIKNTGSTELVRWEKAHQFVDINWTVSNKPAVTTRVLRSNISCDYINATMSFNRDISFDGVPLLSGAGFSSSVCAGEYTETSGKRKVIEDDYSGSLVNSWSHVINSALRSGVFVSKDGSGVVHLNTVLNGSAATADLLLTLPAGLRPTGRMTFPLVTGSVVVYDDGRVETAERGAQIPVNISWVTN